MEPQEKLKVECITLAQTFETFWAFYLQSSGNLFRHECREAAKAFLEAFDELSETEPDLKDGIAEKIARTTASFIDDIVTELRTWTEGSEPFPYADASKSRSMFWSFMSALKGNIVKDLEMKRWPKMTLNFGEALYSADYVKWSGHLPHFVNPESLVKHVSETNTIVVVADIRRSQDLMTYARSSDDFSKRMVDFINNTRNAIKEYGGIFDKFTGDGFIAYFNDAVCKSCNRDYTDAFIEFLQAYSAFAEVHFREWVRHVKKLPDQPVGLGLGADLGIISLQNLNFHLIAVGDTIVWASRMASAAGANDILVNNLLYEQLRNREGLEFAEHGAKTKSGEAFLARKLSFRAR